MKTYIKIILLIGFIIIISNFFLLGRIQGNIQANARYKMFNCDNPIYPYGCKLHNDSNYCLVFDCQMIGFNQNTAFCTKVLDPITQRDKIPSSIIASIVYGCPAYWEEIGINKYTGHQNWKFNKE